jgi:hypothetical protein
VPSFPIRFELLVFLRCAEFSSTTDYIYYYCCYYFVAQMILADIMLRRTKRGLKKVNELKNCLPPKVEKILTIELPPDEREIYNALYESTVDRFEKASVIFCCFFLLLPRQFEWGRVCLLFC